MPTTPLTVSRLSPLPSLALKLAALGVTAACITWWGWGTDRDPAPRAEPEAPLASSAPAASAPKAGRPTSPPAAAVRESARVDLNQATVAELERLPGVGSVLAQRMIAHREAKGGFGRIEDLLEVKGIGRKRLEQLRALLTVELASKSIGKRKPS